MKEESDDDYNTKAFGFVIESQKRKVKLGIDGCKKGESGIGVRVEKEKGVKEKGEQRKQIRQKCLKKTKAKQNKNKSWTSNTCKIKETDSLDNMGVTLKY